MKNVFPGKVNKYCVRVLRMLPLRSFATPFGSCETAQRDDKKEGRGSGRTVLMEPKPVSLKDLAEGLGLPPATVSLVINRSPVADSISQETKDRIFAAIRKHKYRPNFFARSLRAQHSFAIGVIVPEVSDGYSASVMTAWSMSPSLSKSPKAQPRLMCRAEMPGPASSPNPQMFHYPDCGRAGAE